MKELKFICAQPDDTYYTWQVHLWLESLRERGYSDKAIVLIYIPHHRERNSKWDQVISLYPETEFVFYKAEPEMDPKVGIYIPVLRPYCLWRYFTEHPEMKDKAVFYYDSDVLLTDKFDIQKFIDDDIIYLSDTNSYVNASYFDSKIKDVKPDMLEEYKKIDVLADATKIVGINREICEYNNKHSGGAQYLLKNIDGNFWYKVMKDCVNIRIYLHQTINRKYFENENKGFQSWCSDMWAVLWNLWLRGQKTMVVPEMNFAWATDPIEKLDKCSMFHNAGIGSVVQNGHPCFYKGKYHTGLNPVTDPHLDRMLNDEKSKKYCTWWYASKLKALHDKYKLVY